MKLSQQILLLIVSIMLVLGIFNTIRMYQQEKAIYKNSEKILVNSISRGLANTLVEDVISGKKLKVSNALRKIQTQDNSIQFVYVTDVKHNIFAHSFGEGFPRYLLKEYQHKHTSTGTVLEDRYQTKSGLVYLYRTPLINGLNVYLHLGINQTKINKDLRKNTLNNIKLNIAVIIIALLLGYLLTRYVTKPLTELTKSIQQFGTDDFEKNIHGLDHASQEVKVLADTFIKVSQERHQALVRLQEREQDLSITLNSIGDAVIATDKEGNITRMNPVAEQMTGWSLDEARGKSVKTIFTIVDATTGFEMPNPVEKVLASGETIYLSNHTTLIAKDGTEFQISDSAAPIRNADNETLGMVLIFNDVTEQYALRQSASKSKRDLQLILDNSPAVIYTKDIDGKYIFINNKFESLFNINRDDMVGKTDHDIFAKEHADAFRQNDLEVIEAKQNIESEEIAPHDDGPHTYISNKFPLFDDDGNIYAICGISTDITERIKANEKLRHVQRMDALGKLTGGIAHDYNNMLGIILGYAEVLEEAVKGQPTLSEYVYEIRHAGERGAHLTKRLLNFSRNKVSKSEFVDINRLLRASEGMLKKTLMAGIDIVLDLSDELWPVWMDMSDFEDAIVNMSINASHAMDGHGQLTIETKNMNVNSSNDHFIDLAHGDYVMLSLTDTGSGMNKVTQERLFDPFYSTKGEMGTGLGLSQVYGFVERSQGLIKVYSEEGHGSRFMLYFPRYEVDSEKEENKENSNTNDFSGHENLLIVDDEPVLLKLTTEVLSKQGYHITTANSAAEALKKLENNPIDLMISDIIMPDVDGYELAKLAREKYPQLKIQLATGFSGDHGKHAVDSDLQDNILQKPYNFQLLMSRIRELLDQE